MAKSDSVAEGESETMRVGRFGTVTFPVGVVIVTGNCCCAAAPETRAAKAAATTAATMVNVRST